jgi:hypothetical protein
MKRFFLLTVLFTFIAFTSNAQTAPATKGPKLTFDNGQDATDVDYGNIEFGSDRVRKVKLTNTGNEPLIINSATGSCGCTVPTPPKDPILPGESAFLEINYDTNRPGGINKTVTVRTAHGTEHYIRVLGTVKPQAAKEIAVPVGNSIIKTEGGNN